MNPSGTSRKRLGARLFQPLARRAGWTLVDEGLASLSNFGITVFAAHVTSPKNFGAFAIAFTTYVFAIALSEAVGSDPLIIRYSARDSDSLSDPIKRSTGVCLLNGIVAGLVCVAIGLAFGGTVGSALVALGLIFPGLTLQDCWRFVFFAKGDPRSAAFNDFMWCAGQVGAMGVLLLMGGGHPSIFALIIAWGCGAWLGALFGILQARLLPNPRQAKFWLRRHRDLAPSLVADTLIMNSGPQLTLYLVAIVGGLDQVGGVRGATALLGPLTTVFAASRTFAIPELVRLKERDYERTKSFAWLVAFALGTLTICYCAALVALPASVGHKLLGASWKLTRPLLPVFSLVMVGRALTHPCLHGLRALDAPKHLLWARVRAAPLLAVGGIAGALTDGAMGAVIGMAAGSWIGVGIWWMAFGRAFRANHPDRRTPAPEPEAGDLVGLAVLADGAGPTLLGP